MDDASDNTRRQNRIAATAQFTPDQFARVSAYGVAQNVRMDDILFRPGDPSYDLIVIESGRVRLVAPATRDEGEAAVAEYGPGGFLGELNLLTGQTVYLAARVLQAGRIHRISPADFRRLMADDPEISDLLLRTFLARRENLRGGTGARAIEIVGHETSTEALALRTYAARQLLPHVWLDADSAAGRALMQAATLTATDLPAVSTPDRLLARATPGQLAEVLGLAYRHTVEPPADLTIVGAGPAGLAAAVYGASEGLDTVLLDAVGQGGQAAASSRIENYLGFPSGLSGADLTHRAALQALKFGARLSSPTTARGLDVTGATLRVEFGDGDGIDTRAILIATGARYRKLPLARWQDFEGAGIYYAATDLEARSCVGAPVTVVGGANSAGQAALYLATVGSAVTLAVRGEDLRANMSAYLVDRIHAHPGVDLRLTTEITALIGRSHLEAITLTDRATSRQVDQRCRGLFCFVGADPATGWLTQVALDAHGYILTDVHLDPHDLGPTWRALGRGPLPFETSVPGVFAAGDVRHGSQKRVASAVGEGATAVRSVHAAIGARY